MKARLSKEAQTVSEGQQASTGEPYRYLFAAAETLSEDFKRLGSAADGSTYLDCIRRLIIGIWLFHEQPLWLRSLSSADMSPEDSIVPDK